jgi:hypothetical protein
MTPTNTQQDDPDAKKGAVEGDRPADKQHSNRNASGDGGVDANGMPNDPVATAQDKIGANEDETQG